MSALFDTMCDEIFQILKGSGKTLTLYDVNGNRVYDPASARTVFIEPDKMVLGVKEDGDDSEIKLYLSNSANISEDENPKLSKLINTLRHISTRYNVLFNVRKYGRELSPKDFAYQAEPVAESFMESMWGTSKTSYQKIGDSKIVVRHCSAIREEVRGARSRRILSLFVETKAGERFKFPINHLSGARAWAQHLSSGGSAHDAMGTHIIECAIESLKLANMNTFMNYNRKSLSEEAMLLRYPIRTRIAELRKTLVRYSKPKGYKQALESEVYSTPRMIQESQTVGRECDRVAALLGIDSNHALAESLLPVALLTIGENKMFNNSDGMFHRVITLENEATMAELAEALVSEYGHDHGFSLEEGLMIVSEGVYDDAVSYLEALSEAYSIYENEDKFLAYASSWMKNRLSKAGEGSELSPEQEQQAQALADGLKGILAGKAPGHPVMDGNPRFANPQAELAYKVGAFLDAKSGIKNDALWTYISTIVDGLQHGKKLSSTEQMFATKLAQMASNANESVVDEGVFVEAGNDDPNHINYGGDDQAYQDACEEIAGDFSKWHLKDFLKKYYAEFAQNGQGEDPVSPEDVKGDLTGYLRDVLASQYEMENTDPRDLADMVFPDVEKFATQHGWTFEKSVNEARGPSKVTFDTSIDFEGDDDFEVKVTASVDDDYIDFESIVSKIDGRDILEQMPREQLENLQDQVMQAAAEQHADHLDRIADMKRDRMMDEDSMDGSFAMPMTLDLGDHVSTPVGPGRVEEVENDVVTVELLHGGHKQFHIGDVEKVDVDQEMGRPRMKEEIELEKWFEQFDPEHVTLHASLATQQTPEHKTLNDDLEEEQLDEYGASSFDSKNPTIQKLVKYLKNNWELSQASSDKLMFNKPVGKRRFKITVMPEGVILDVFSDSDLLAHKRFGEGGLPLGKLAGAMQEYTSVREDFRIDDSAYLPELTEDEDEVGGDMGDDFKDEVEKEKDPEQVEEAVDESSDMFRLLQMAGLKSRF